MDASKIVKYFILFSFCMFVNKLVLKCVTEFGLGNFIILSIAISSGTLFILNLVFAFSTYINKRLQSLEAPFIRPLAPVWLLAAYSTNVFLTMLYIEKFCKIALWTVRMALYPVKLFDAIVGSHNHYSIMASLTLIDLYLEFTVFVAVAGAYHYFQAETRFLERSLILERRVPRLRYGDLRKGETKNGECVICLECFRSEDLVRVVSACKHCYHVKCIDKWFKENHSCPICRANLLPPEYEVEI